MLRITLPLPKDVTPAPTTSRVAIIGGGFTGASLARLLAVNGQYGPDDIVVFESRAGLGGGLAYGTRNPSLRLNVAAHRMRAVPGDPQAFVHWLSASGRLDLDPDAVGDGGIYARRADFAAFMAEQIQPFLDRGSVRHVRERAERICRRHGRWQIEGDRGASVQSDIVVIATGHPPPTPPDLLSDSLGGDARLISDPLPSGALQAIGPDDKVLVVGAGLTALDAVGVLRAKGHCAEVTLLSRTGQLPQPQASGDFAPHGDFLIGVPNTALSLLERVRFALEEVTEAGLPWQSVFDALRHQGQAIWQALPLVEQRRVLRHLRRRFEAHRFRMSPQIAELVERERAAGRLRSRAGRIVAVRPGHAEIVVDIATKPHGIVVRHAARWIIAATGPDHRNVIGSQSCLADMEGSGLLRNDPHGLGIACDEDSRAVARDGYPVEDLFIAGPLARGAFGELTGVPEIAAQAERIVQQVLAMRFATTRTITIRSL
ncbi:hydroxyacylglutathione hydrolase [Sinorhizobium americanum CCGM7]|uniref:FAD/NAD(P)-binding protein n=1 Tax=Sinorhizobium americanum TaxID=194963 RepID=UPI0004DA08AA|nr:FAD/NAD(P)-binding protein [Sinorhizobium americanum]APG85509.1 hydroxyacylglutathione hydrolase [Sinorhizobium americanum CCGM7]